MSKWSNAVTTTMQTKEPVKPWRMTSQFDRTVDRVRVTCRVRQWGAGCFMMLWLTAWTVGCVFLAGVAITKPHIFAVLFGIPFWASWFAVFFALLNAFLRKDELEIDATQARFTRRVVVKTKRRVIPISEIRRFELYSKMIGSESGQTEAGLEMITLGKPLQCFGNLSNDELTWLQFQLNDFLKSARRQAKETVDNDTVEPRMAMRGLEVTTKGADEGPTDSSWRRVDDFTDISFVQRGKLSIANLFGLLFINLFWNGVVSVFVAVLWGLMPGDGALPRGSIMWWGLFVFLIPFEAIGLVMLGGLLAAFFEPMKRTRWTFADLEIRRSKTWLGFGRTQRWEVIRLDRIQMRTTQEGEGWLATFFKARNMPTQSEATDGGKFGLIFIDKTNAEVCRMQGLTEGEARWISQTLQQSMRAWFR